ncbi:LysR substrate-binding domain-containing protein [Catellatospora citrea]|uniref:LysR substrate-binding domain-containing protein n=1 Tax=Catellatospora citrea TaxID=53366 RepID=UPI0033D9DC9B
MDVSTKGLRSFVVLAEELHFGRAADRLGIAQPAVSQQVQRLEQALGLRLFERAGHRVTMTDAGLAFLPDARRSLDAQARAISAARSAWQGTTGELRLGVTATAPPQPLTTLLRRFCDTYPGTRVSIREHTLDRVIGLLLDGELHAVVTTGFSTPHAAAELVFDTLGQERLLVAMPSDHPLRVHPEVPLCALAEEHFAVIARDAVSARTIGIQGLCEREGFEPKVFAEVHDATMQLAMVAAAGGVAVVPASARHHAPPQVAFTRLRHDNPLRTMLARRRDDHSPALKALLTEAEIDI